jgi:hypothetical protein
MSILNKDISTLLDRIIQWAEAITKCFQIQSFSVPGQTLSFHFPLFFTSLIISNPAYVSPRAMVIVFLPELTVSAIQDEPIQVTQILARRDI